MKVGYIHVSTLDLNLTLQHDTLSKHGCERILQDKVCGVTDK
jgi:hypothetical protein